MGLNTNDFELELVTDCGMQFPTDASKKRVRYAEFKCACGKVFKTQVAHVKSGNTKSCGCFQKAQTSRASKTHGLSESSTYNTWSEMKARCLNSANGDYPRYGGRGITVCDIWLNFEGFLEDMGERPGNLELDRIDNDKGYCMANCRWATRSEQVRNSVHTKKSSLPIGVDISYTKKDKSTWSYRARISHNGKHVSLGSYSTKKRAAEAYNDYITTNGLIGILNDTSKFE